MLTTLSTLVFLLASTLYLVSARQAIGTESLAVTGLVDAMLRDAPQSDGVPVLPGEALRGLDHARHIRARVPGAAPEPAHAYPGWFGHLVRADTSTWSRRVMVTGSAQGPYAALLLSTPDDELAEKWSDAKSAFWLLSVLLAALNGGTWLIVYWQLHPLQALRAALDSVGTGERNVRVEPSAVEEVAAVQVGFNRMAVALREAGDRNRELTRELLRVQEEERRAIARELHDEFAQHVTAINAEAAVLAHVMQDRPSGLASVASIRSAARILMRMVRGRLEQLRPEVLDEFGVIVAIEELCDGFRAAHPDVEVMVSLPTELPIAEERSIAVFRVLQESLTNVARHARAGVVEVTLDLVVRHGERFLEMQVVDDGVGIAAPAARQRGFGLLGMKERLESLGGSLHFGVAPTGRGLAVQAALPLADRGTAG